jgi:hypothetical protein
VCVARLEGVEDGGEFFRKDEQAAVGGRLLIAQSRGEAIGGKASAGDAGGEPGLVYLSEETCDLIPAGALAGFAGIAYEHDVEVQAVAGGIDHAVGAAADQVAEDGQKLEENGGGMGLSVRSNGTDGESGETMEGGFAQVGVRDGSGRGCARCFWWRRRVRPVGGLFGLTFVQKREEFGLAPLYIGKCRYVGPTIAGG